METPETHSQRFHRLHYGESIYVRRGWWATMIGRYLSGWAELQRLPQTHEARCRAYEFGWRADTVFATRDVPLERAQTDAMHPLCIRDAVSCRLMGRCAHPLPLNPRLPSGASPPSSFSATAPMPTSPAWISGRSAETHDSTLVPTLS